jgi:hypothetical protein
MFLSADDQGRFKGLVVMSGWQLQEYLKHHQCVIFDTTFQTNSFGFPLGALVGIDAFGSTVCFALCVISNEDTESFEWVFKSILEFTNIEPEVIFTDEDLAMANAIKSTLPHAKHNLCSWHIEKNLRKKLYSILKDDYEKIRRTFWSLAMNDFTEDYCEKLFDYMHDICDKRPGCKAAIDHIYAVKEKWCKCYSRNVFTINQSATSRVEAINSLIKRYNSSRQAKNIDEFMNFFEKIIEERMQTRQVLNETDVRMKGLRVNPVVMTCFPDGFNCSQYAMDKISEQYLEASTNRRYYSVGQFKSCEDEVQHVLIPINLKGGFLKESNVRSLKSNITFNGVMTEVFLPMHCDCAWYGNWRLPCKHMFMIATSELGSHIFSEVIHPRWNVLTQLEALQLNTFHTPIALNADSDDPPDIREKKRAYADLYADFRTACSVATTLNQEQQLRRMLQNYIAVATGSLVNAPVVAPLPSTNEPAIVTTNPIVAKRKRKKSTKNDIESIITLPAKANKPKRYKK